MSAVSIFLRLSSMTVYTGRVWYSACSHSCARAQGHSGRHEENYTQSAILDGVCPCCRARGYNKNAHAPDCYATVAECIEARLGCTAEIVEL